MPRKLDTSTPSVVRQAPLVGDLKRFGFDLRLLALSTRVDPWAVTEIPPVGNTQQLKRHAGIVNVCVYEIELPGYREREHQRHVRAHGSTASASPL